MLIEKLQPFAIAIAVGLLIGIERERSHPPGIQAMGLRTFVLLSLLGSIAAWLKEPMVAWGITLFAAAIVVMSYMRSTGANAKSSGIGITTEVAAVVTFGLGLMTHTEPLITLILGVAVVLILYGKEHLHTFTRERLKTEEFQATLTILILALSILPFLPNELIDPWMLFNPRKFGILVLSIAIMQFGAYVVSRIFGAKRGILLSGLLNGFISSAIATANFAQEVKKRHIPPKAAAAAIAYSTVSMYLKFLIIIALISPPLLNLASWPVLCSCLVGTAIATKLTQNLTIDKEMLPAKNPIALWSALRLALVLACMLIAIAIAQRVFGNAVTHIVSFLGGLFDIHSVSFAVATLQHESELGIDMAMGSLGLAILASYASKLVMIIMIGRSSKAFIGYSFLILIAMFTINLIVWLMAMGLT